MALIDQSELRTWLNGVNYPAGKEDLVSRAERNGAPDHVISALRAIPPVEYASRSEVAASVRVDDPQSDAEKADERRHHTHDGLAEKETEVPPNPIAEELGYNRKR